MKKDYLQEAKEDKDIKNKQNTQCQSLTCRMEIHFPIHITARKCTSHPEPVMAAQAI
jgi:hypothetical protein